MKKSKFDILFESIQNEFETLYDFDTNNNELKNKVFKNKEDSDISDIHNTILTVYGYKNHGFSNEETIIDNFKYAEPDKTDIELIEDLTFDIDEVLNNIDDSEIDDNVYIRIEVKDKNSDKVFFDKVLYRKDKSLVLDAINGLKKEF
jgi:hypothetical protein